MKYLIIILFASTTLLVYPAYAQEKQKCDSGWQFFPTISYDYAFFIADTCVPDSVAKKWWRFISMMQCDRVGLYIESDKTRYWETGKWNDSLGCVTKRGWQKYIMVSKKNYKWVDITKQEYDSLNKTNKII